ncbi:G-D-S-L family lipolytic protein [Ginsengibacter hankyongi]|uniref:G-D-S-L family lipolytic protein n=1 Tax=Ginsengibacter hankyongi TaxID=2607284 RepID=A0A5J5IHX0_9BACT|nr:GDSL-type esterase/lipase family protein [Ginsengibacter hankyongi]KAA9037634.1 G-D-S-L family lipolytic protein [Ginsengibacter hankyongi]
MNKTLKIITCFLFLFFAYTSLPAQQHLPFYDEIEHFKKLDSAHFPPKNAVLFVGSSSIRKWEDVQNYFPNETVINRGFGGSELTDAIRYANDIIIPYHPREIVIYSGENDLAYADSITPAIVLRRFETLFNIIRSAMPKVPVIYVSIKPSPSRERLMPEMEVANKLIKQFLKSKNKTVFVDVYHKMLDKSGTPMTDIFLSDNLHMNAKGYHIWQKAITPYLERYKN